MRTSIDSELAIYKPFMTRKERLQWAYQTGLISWKQWKELQNHAI